MKRPVEIFSDLKNTSSRNEKEQILKENENNKVFKMILKFLYDPFIVTGISSKKINKKVKADIDNTIMTYPALIDYLKINNSGRDADIAVIQRIINELEDEETKQFIKEIATKNLKCGITATTINKVYGDGFIPLFGVQLAEKYKEHKDNVTDDFFITQKMDGIRGVAFNEADGVKFYTRKGKEISGLVDLEETFKNLPKGFVYDGELLLINKENLNSGDLFRKTQSIVSSKGIKKDIEFHVFDLIPIEEFKLGESKDIYEVRRNKMNEIFSKYKGLVKLVPILYHGNDKSMIDKLFKEALEKGQEGIMINNNVTYKIKRIKDLLKVKGEESFEGVVVGVYEGKEDKKNKDKLGGIQITYKDIIVNVGNGFTDKERELYWKNPDLVIGKVAEIQFTEESQDENGELDLRFARWKGIRNDKTAEDVNY